MSELRFDAYALDDEDATGEAHPLEIARDLIALGKPRSALEVLSLHHDQLADDPEYLLICSEGWWATGDSLRAQQALLGAARLTPDDPVPMQLLAELLRERGEHDKAERAQQKADALELASARARESRPSAPLEVEDDLIAFAEQQERSAQAGTTPEQILLAVLVVGIIGGLVAAIAWLAESERSTLANATTSATPEDAAPASTPAPAEPSDVAAGAEPAPSALEEPSTPKDAAPASIQAPAEPVQTDLPSAASSASAVAESAPVEQPARPTRTEARVKSKRAAPKPAKRAPKPEPRAAPAAPAPEPSGPAAPDAATVQSELASTNASELTARADFLFAQGHTGIAAGYYRRALEVDPDYAPALVGIGRSILRAEKYDEAMRNATRALHLARGVDSRPGLEAEAIYQIGRVHLHRGDLDAARRLFRQSISLSGTPSAAWFYLGEALWNDNSPAAREAYERYLELVSKGHLADRARRAIQ